MQNVIIYSYKDKSGETGTGRIFIENEYEKIDLAYYQQVEEHIKKKNNLDAVMITNIIKLED